MLNKESILNHADHYALLMTSQGKKIVVVLPAFEVAGNIDRIFLTDEKYRTLSDNGKNKYWPFVKAMVKQYVGYPVEHTGNRELEKDCEKWLRMQFGETVTYHGDKANHKADYSYIDKAGIERWVEVKGLRGWVNK